MSECVVRMEMPEDKSCPFDFNLPKMGNWCWIEDKSCSYCESNIRPSWCPIICQLPEGHGRLVDADALDKHVYNDIPISVFGSVKKMASVRQIIEDAPTIVPAEAERSEKDGR